MTRSLLLVALLMTACSGGTGPQGPQGPAGPPYNRYASYCNSNTTTTRDATTLWATAQCTNVDDTPIEGWCTNGEVLPAGAGLWSESPNNWATHGVAASWTCIWAFTGGAPDPATFPGTANICCATPSP